MRLEVKVPGFIKIQIFTIFHCCHQKTDSIGEITKSNLSPNKFDQEVEQFESTINPSQTQLSNTYAESLELSIGLSLKSHEF